MKHDDAWRAILSYGCLIKGDDDWTYVYVSNRIWLFIMLRYTSCCVLECCCCCWLRIWPIWTCMKHCCYAFFVVLFEYSTMDDRVCTTCLGAPALWCCWAPEIGAAWWCCCFVVAVWKCWLEPKCWCVVVMCVWNPWSHLYTPLPAAQWCSGCCWCKCQPACSNA